MDAENWRVRPAELVDADALALIGAATFLDSFSGTLAGQAIVAHCRVAHAQETYEAYFEHGARAWLAEAKPGDAPIGYALLTEPDLPGAEPGDIELKRIYSLARYHGSGVGPALMAAAVSAASGANRLLLGVYAANARALAFYRKHGFVEIGTRQFNVGGALYDDVVLARAL
jgi:diamine N-acetyltransferase